MICLRDSAVLIWRVHTYRHRTRSPAACKQCTQRYRTAVLDGVRSTPHTLGFSMGSPQRIGGRTLEISTSDGDALAVTHCIWATFGRKYLRQTRTWKLGLKDSRGSSDSACRRLLHHV